LALDHLTAVDATPLELLDLATGSGCQAVSLFLHPLSVLPQMPAFDLVADAKARALFSARRAEHGLKIDLVYPFTLAGSTEPEVFAPALAAAAELGAGAINVLVYDRDEGRRIERLARLSQMAADHGLATAVEFFPPSQVRSLAEALALVEAVDHPGLGVNVDLLHLIRSGDGVEALAQAPPGRLIYAQLCDGSADCAPADRAREAAFERLAPGEGVFDLAGFLAALPATTALSVEAPLGQALAQGVSPIDRVQRAVAGARAALSYDIVQIRTNSVA
jgi:sugar phosphate isomerase/epimerase